MRVLLVAIVLAVLAGCASTVPEAIRNVPDGGPQPDEVRGEPERFVDSTVRWGGTIVSVTNKAEFTEIEMVARPLDDRARPKAVDRNLGRFLARVPGFLDPAVYDSGRGLTVTGTVAGTEERAIGEYAYRFPVVAVDGYHLWAPARTAADRRPYPYDPYWYDPWYPRSMFYPYCPYGVSPRYCW